MSPYPEKTAEVQVLSLLTVLPFLSLHMRYTKIPFQKASGGFCLSGTTDTMGRMHSDAQFAGSSSVPAHVEMMGLIGMGNNPMVGATVAVAVSVEEAHKAGKF